MIDALARSLKKAGFGPTIADLEAILWLAERLPKQEPRPTDAEPAAQPPDKTVSPARASPKKVGTQDGTVTLDRRAIATQTGEASTKLFSGPQSDGTIKASTLRVPGVAATERPRDIVRALQPFARRVRSAWRRRLDDAETAARAAETGVWWPIFRPVRERWFDLSLILDSSPAMDLWTETLNAFQRSLRSHGSFRHVTVYRLRNESDGSLAIVDAHRSYSVTHFADTAHRHVVLLATDATSARWRTGAAQSLLFELAAVTSATVLHMLPRRYWEHTPLGQPELVLSTIQAGSPNARLVVSAPWWLDEEETKLALPVPIIGLDATGMRQWAKVMTASGGAAVPGVLVAPRDAEASHPRIEARRGSAPSAAARVANYRAAVSRSAYELAVFLSVPHPLTVPVMRLIQRTMLPDTGTAELAEFFVGGLIERVDRPALPGEPSKEEALYGFVDGVREELTRSLRYSEEDKITAQLRLVGRYLLEQGREGAGFAAYFPAPTGQQRLADWSLAFASVSQEVLRNEMGLGDRQPPRRKATARSKAQNGLRTG